MKKRNGFTLAELLGVITILGILALIMIPAIDKSSKEGKEELYASQIKSIESAAKMWGTDHVASLPEEGKSTFIYLYQLQQEGYIGDNIKNPKNNKPFSPGLQVKITSHGTYYTYQVVE